MRVAIVDCLVNERAFVSDEVFRALADRLREGGIDASLLDLVRDNPATGKSTQDVLDRLRALAPNLVVLSRAWSETLVEAIRHAAAPGARIVRHSRGAPSAIDERFDAVLDGDSIVALASGAENLSAPKWRRSRQELRLLTPAPAPTSGGRPAISGPAKGCPFLVDVRTSPAFRDSAIDFDSVQSKGCSFCLDNVGAFAAFPEEVVVDAWLTQLRALRREQPELREILLTDERPHPYLPALFRAILAEPALHGVELLVKTRVDWLDEFADTALQDACELAAASGSLLYIYLVGFESFHQADLDLFNKAVTVTDNVQAIATLRRLEARHPSSFAFRRHRAHGIVLFHPWTTPESLLDNARVMREVRFHELRSQALRTRLRLYASVPLHALAERDGLLTDKFEEGRDDRAIEQGYDASLPWRFADARIEAIFRAANRLAEAMPELLDADILEMATRFVLRWPAFAEDPDLAALPLLYAPLSWGPSPADVVAIAGATVAGFDREVEAVAAGEKPASLKEAVDASDADDLVRAYQLMGLTAGIVSMHDRGGDDGRHNRGYTHAIVAVARDAATLDQVIEHQHAVERGEKPSHVFPMGELMGYPRCCVDVFAEKIAHDDNLDLERAPFRAHPEQPLAPLVNRLGAVSLLSHLLCSPSCARSVAIAEVRLGAVARLDADAARRIEQHLATPILRVDYRRAALLQGAWDKDRYRVRSLQPLMNSNLGVDPEAVAAIRLAVDGVLFELKDGSRRAVAAPGPLLVEPGRPLAPAARRVAQASTNVAASATWKAAPTRLQPRLRSTGTDIEAALSPQTKAGDYLILRTDSDGSGGYRVTLQRDGELLRVHIHPWDPARTALSRRGTWALDLLQEETEPTESQRSVIGALARLLPAGGHQDGESAKPSPEPPSNQSSRGRNTDRGVICTAPWTTLEIVDPDGRARQCCADWTVGDRGNLHQQSLVEVWNGDGYRMARRVMSSNSLGPLCNAICPRLYDAKFAERELTMVPGAAAFVENQRLLMEDITARREVVRAKPLYIAVCPSTYCNYNCIMCLHGRSPRRDLPESIWDDLLSMLPTLRVLTLLGGEPLANPQAMRFLRAWDRRKYPDAAVSLVTNGSLLGPSVLSQLEGCRFGSVTVSLNAGTPDVYAQVQRGIAWQEVLTNIDALIELRRRQRIDFPIILSFVVQPANHSTLIAFAETARARGLPIRLMPLSPHGPEGLDFYEDGDEVARILESLDAMAAWAKQAAPEYGREIHGTRTAVASEAAGRRTPAAAGAAR